MKESPFVAKFESIIKKSLSNKFILKRGANLLYQMSLNSNLELSIKEKDLKNPKRGSSAFQTDICIFEKVKSIEIPRIVIEFKTTITTHDVLTYSTKAGKHKNIYPFLRYGMLASDLEIIPSRFFVHNENIDFFIAGKKYHSSQKIKKMALELIKKELKISRTLEDINFGKKAFNFYQTNISFRNY